MPSSWRILGSGEPMNERKIGAHSSRLAGRSRVWRTTAFDVPPRMKTAGSFRCDMARLVFVVAGWTVNQFADLKLLVPRLNELAAQQEKLEAMLSSAADRDVVALHPQAAERYRQKVAEIREALTKGDSASA